MVREALERLAIKLGQAVFCPLSHRSLFRLCDVLSAVYYFFDRKGRKKALRNLRIIFKKEDTLPLSTSTWLKQHPYNPTLREEKIIRGSYRNMARTVGHIFWTSVHAKERVALVGVMCRRGHEWLHEVKQAVTVSGHIGCWEILAQIVHQEGLEMVSVAKKIGSKKTTQMLMESRRSIGEEIVPAESAFLALAKAMKKGKCLGLLVDQTVNPEDGGMWIRFFGKPMCVSAAPAYFSGKFKAPIVTAWSRPLKDGRYVCEVINTYSWEEAKNTWKMTQQCAKDLEGVIRRHPSLWVLNYNMFKRKAKKDEIAELEKNEAANA